MLPNRWPLLLLFLPLLLPAQERSDFQQILQRLDQLERENRNLADEVHALRAEIAGARPLNPPGETPTAVADAPVNVSPVPIDERTAVLEQRTDRKSVVCPPPRAEKPGARPLNPPGETPTAVADAPVNVSPVPIDERTAVLEQR